MKKIAFAMALLLSTSLVTACSAEDAPSQKAPSNPAQEQQSYECPDGWKEISIGSVATYIPEAWQKDDSKSVDTGQVKLDAYGYPGYEIDQQATLIASESSKIQPPAEESPKAYENALKSHIESGKDINQQIILLDFEEVDGIWVQPYSVVSPDKTKKGFDFFLDGSLYGFSFTGERSTDIEDPTDFMQIYLHRV